VHQHKTNDTTGPLPHGEAGPALSQDATKNIIVAAPYKCADCLIELILFVRLFIDNNTHYIVVYGTNSKSTHRC